MLDGGFQVLRGQQPVPAGRCCDAIEVGARSGLLNGYGCLAVVISMVDGWPRMVAKIHLLGSDGHALIDTLRQTLARVRKPCLLGSRL